MALKISGRRLPKDKSEDLPFANVTRVCGITDIDENMRHFMKSLLVIASLGMVSASLSAQTDSTAHRLDEVQVVDSRKHYVMTSTAPLYVMDHGEMVRLGVTDMADALHRLPGITLRDYGGAGGMKTVSVRGLGAQNTGVSYDGIALSDCQTGQIDLQRYTLNGIHDLRLVVAGDNDVFQPARNVASAAMLELRTDTLGNAASLTMGSWGYTNPMVQLATPMGKRLKLSALIDYVYAENDYPFTLTNVRMRTRERRTNSRMNQWHGEMNMMWMINDRNRLSGKLYYYDNDRQLPGIVHYYTNDNDETLHERNAFAQLQWRSTLGEKWRMMVNGKWNWFTSDYGVGRPSGGITSAEYWQREGYVSVATLYTPVDWLMLDYSADYVMNNMNSSLAVSSRPRRHSILQSMTAKMQWNGLTLLARGLMSVYLNDNRGTSSNTTPTTVVNGAAVSVEPDEHNFAPSLSASYRLFSDERLYVRASWKRIFRMPTFNELYYYHLGNPMLSPEKTNQWNVGMTWQRDGRFLDVMLTMDGYLNRVTDKIVAIPYNMFVWRTVNVGKVEVLGMDVTADLLLSLSKRHSLGLTGNYSLQRAKNKSVKGRFYGNQIAYTPVHSGSATLSWTNPWVNLSLTTSGASSRWTTNEHTDGTKLDGYMEWSASAYRTQSIWGVPITLRASVLNIFDKQYDIVAHYPMPGRSWKVALSWNL